MDYKKPLLSPEERAENLLSVMTLEEKIAQTDILRGVEYATKPSAIHLCSVEADSELDTEAFSKVIANKGIGFIHDCYSEPVFLNKLQKFVIENSRLGIPCIFTAEALHGVSGLGATIFPVPLALSASFDRENVNKVGSAIGSETRTLGMQEILAPNLDVVRDVRWGRTEETFGEDTYLSCEMAYAIITGEQKNGELQRADAVVCEPKHYCVHGMPENGLNCAEARVGVREIETCYLPVFETAIKKAGAPNVMACYNSIDREVVMTSKHYLTDVLRGRFGMNGYVRADWGGIKRVKDFHRVAATYKDAICDVINAGLDTQGCCDFDNDTWQNTVLELVNEGRISENRINEAAKRVLELKFRLGLFENPYTDEEKFKSVIRNDEHREIALNSAYKAMTLIKNDGVLPLKKLYKKIALLGPNSASQKIGGYSSLPTGYRIKSVFEELRSALGEKTEILQCEGCGIPKASQIEQLDGQPHLIEVYEENYVECIDKAVKIAGECDIAIIVGGDNTYTSGEGHDRADLKLAGKQRELILEVAKTGKPVILVLENGRAVDLSLESEACSAILVSWFGGEFGAKAIVDTLTGKYNPAGRLPISFPADSYRIPCYYTELPNISEMMFEGSRRPRYPFGHGLSYTEFEYSNIKVEKTGEYNYSVSADIKNTGGMSGEEVVQLYVEDIVSSVATPIKELKGFERILLKSGESKTVEFKLDFDSFKLLNKNFEWVVEEGEFNIMVGASSNDIRLSKKVEVFK